MRPAKMLILPALFPRGARVGTAVSFVTALTAGASGDVRAAPGRDARDVRSIRGTVLDHVNHQPCVARTIVVGEKRTTTDAKGRFTLPSVPEVYDLAVVEPNRATASFYQGLRRRDLILVQHIDYNQRIPGLPAHAAHVDGNLSGGGFDPKSSNNATVHFFSPHTTRDTTLGGSNHQPRGASYGPLPLFWMGPESITGTVLAVRTTREKTDGDAKSAPAVWWEAHKELKVASGEVATADLAFNRLPMGRIAGKTEVEGEGTKTMEVTGLGITYRLPVGALGLDGDGRERRPAPFDFAVPDLRHLSGQYCADAYDGARGIFAWSVKCGVSLGAKDVVVKLYAPPTLSTPENDGHITREAEFAWTAYSGGVHRLAIECAVSAENPSVFVHSTGTRVKWPDVGAVGVAFPKNGETCKVSVTGLGPYRGMDDAFGPDGVGARFPRDARGSRSREAYVKIAAPGARAKQRPGQVKDDEAPSTR